MDALVLLRWFWVCSVPSALPNVVYIATSPLPLPFCATSSFAILISNILTESNTPTEIMDPHQIEHWIADILFDTNTEECGQKRPLEDLELSPKPDFKRPRTDLASEWTFPYPDVLESFTPSASDVLIMQPDQPCATPTATSREEIPLGQLKKPIFFKQPIFSALPDDVGSLWQRLNSFATFRHEIFPASVKAKVRSVGPFVPEACFQPPSQESTTVSWEKLERLVRAARSCMEDSCHKSVWNFEVHYPLLEAITRSHADATVEVLTTTTINNLFLPIAQSSTSDVSRATAKLIDFGVALRPDDDLEARLEAFLQGVPFGERSINATRSIRLRHRLITIPIETKAAAARTAVANAHYQLAIWTAAWHNRIARLDKSLHMPTLPAICVVGHEWDLYLAEDKGDHIIVHGPLRIGSTIDILNMYSLLRCLQSLVDWATTRHRGWVCNLMDLCERRREEFAASLSLV
ncbi:hypothetical protein LX32DRAFT_289345 [Colletotrichum zoysiae]|uniref:PD-(D/E)XK nuclease-like domain-containing protein n=1 Tax=Colletotrichum zoysiae TaxID=1216348 RepID=A0AAD9M784_9PEZI|nr:hypothetical protein LX32DRAFT_289345 [Colletotrichum zoysiae]